MDTQNWKLVLGYDGTDFHGWQVQPGLPTVQSALARAIADITGETVLPQGSGRTDAGVHAEGQVANFALRAPLPEENMRRALNRALPDSIRVVRAEVVPAEFHARHSAKAKTYEYRILLCPEDIPPCPPAMARYWLPVWRAIDIAAMKIAAASVVGEHDFASFAASDPDATERISNEVKSAIRTIFSSAWEQDAEKLIYTVRGNGFLHHMVRNLVGTFLDIGYGRIKANDMNAILCARDRSKAGPTAPARGLWLMNVEY
jgi:tRNA pseudouridine38-40 synthase